MKNYPHHLAVIMDGNGRWAKARFLPRAAGHRQGVNALRMTIEFALKQEIAVLTIFALSSENLQHRPKAEINILLNLLLKVLTEETEKLHDNQVCVRVVGDTQVLKPELQDAIHYAETLTAQNKKMNLNIAFNYGGRWDILETTKKICHLVVQKKLDLSTLNEAAFEQYMALKNQPAPDLLIRTSGEQRISNFLLWHLAYTEFYFTKTLWPDMTEHILQEALNEYACRQRKFGVVKTLDYQHV